MVFTGLDMICMFKLIHKFYPTYLRQYMLEEAFGEDVSHVAQHINVLHST